MPRRNRGAWPRGTSPRTTVPEPAPVSARVVIVNKPGAPQTQLRIAAIGPPRSTPDYPTLRVLNEVFGGLFSSRINLNLRERHGYTYGARSTFAFRRSAGPFVVSAPVRNEVTRESVEEVLA